MDLTITLKVQPTLQLRWWNMVTTNVLTVDMHTRSLKRFRRGSGNDCGSHFEISLLREIHPHAEAAAETAEFAATHAKFWEMHDLIFENQNSLSEQMLGELAHRLTLDRRALGNALGSGAFAERVQRDFSGGVRSGVNGTPTFFINSQRHDGDFELQTLLQAIQTIIHNHNE